MEKYLQPNYVEQFFCDGSLCGSRCCKGWRITADAATYEKYRAADEGDEPGILRHFSKNEDNTAAIMLKENGDCPFLLPDGLCRLQKEHGAEFLSDICFTYPRVIYRLPKVAEEAITVVYGQDYSDKDHVAYYLHTYGELPPNYITKKQAEALGWTGGSLEPYAPGKSLGGTYFGNYEGKLPKAKGRTWYECDTGYKGKKRGATRLLYSSDGLYYYTSDHYQTFTQMFPEDSP